MRRGDLLVAALVVAVPGIVLPGCLGSFGEDQAQGRICAAPVEGGEDCVSSGEGPASAWSRAAARGSLPLQMWAERPEGTTLDTLVTSPADMESWLGDIDRALGYVRDEQRSAASYEASMDGRLRNLLGSARIRQKEILAEEPIDAAGRFKEALVAKASSEKDPLVAEIAAEKLSVGAVQGVLDQVTLDVGPLSSAYADLAVDFAAYRTTESAGEMATYTKLAAMTSGAQRSIHAMLGYVDRRIARSDRAAMALLFGLTMRRQALELLGESQAVREQVAEAKTAKAEATFFESAEAHVLAFEQAAPEGVKLSLPYLAKQYDEVTAFLQMRPLCELPSSTWREAGCAAMRPHFKAAATYRVTTLPGLVQTGLSTMKAQGVDGALIEAAAAKLAAGDVKGAAVLHDAALRGAEGT
ncbi:MAG TPA: hypothetical protein VM694_31945 [Polyangium sp.]|nr:hypothetical protein [Polyangium sp.]